MLCADTMPSTNNTALEKGEGGLNRVSVNVALDVNSHAVSDRLVSAIFADLTSSTPVGLVIVGKKHINIVSDILSDVSLKCSRRNIVSVKESEIAPALPDTDYDFFVVPSVLFAFATVYAADKSLIHFDFSAQFGFVDLNHRGADAMAEVPCGLVGLDSKRALNLASAHALLGLTEQYCSEEPSRKRQVSIVEDGVRGDAELVFA